MKYLSILFLLACSACNWPGIDHHRSALDDPRNGADYPAGVKAPLTLDGLPGYHTNDPYIDSGLVDKVLKRDGTNVIGIYMGMIAEWDGATNGIWPNTNNPPYAQGVMMFSATSGECLKWISYEDFKAIFVDKSRPEYP